MNGQGFFPWNLGNHAPYRGLSFSKKHVISDFPENPVETCARFAGWLRAAQEDEVIKHFLRKTQTSRGMNSPYCYGNLWEIIARHPSPGAFRKWILAVRRRANQILKPYGFKVSWYGLGHTAATGPHKVGKAAFRASALSLDCIFSLSRGWSTPWAVSDERSLTLLKRYVGLQDFVKQPRAVRFLIHEKWETKKFSSLREAIQATNIVEDDTDGIKMLIDTTTEQVVHGISKVFGAEKIGHEDYSIHFLYKKGGRSYHASYDMPVKQVVEIWQHQKRLEKEARTTYKSLLPEDRTILVWRQDSIDAGNCPAGTRAFMTKNAIKRDFVPAAWLLKHAKNTAVRRVLSHVAGLNR